MNSKSRRVVNDPELVAPLSGPSYGAYSVARRRWRKPLSAMLADTTANSQALLTRLQRGVYFTDWERKPYFQSVVNQLCELTRQQLKALEDFSATEWSE